MKAFLISLFLFCSLAALFGQQRPAWPLYIPEESFSRRFMIDLEKGNQLQVELSDISLLSRISPLDSILHIFRLDMIGIKDSLADELSSYRIDYIMDSSPVKKLRLQRYPPAGTYFVIQNHEPAALKLAQDTLTITGILPGGAGKPLQYYRLSFFMNRLGSLSAYEELAADRLAVLAKQLKGKWKRETGGRFVLKADPAISAPASYGYAREPETVSLRISIDAQNYKHYFVPSISVAVVFGTGYTRRREFGAGLETHFLFAKDSAGKLHTHDNNFLTVSYKGPGIPHKRYHTRFSAAPYYSIGYLLRRRGEWYDKHSFKLGLGRFTFFSGYTSIEPSVYIGTEKRRITPSLRLTQYF